MNETIEKKLNSFLFPVCERAVFIDDDKTYKPTKHYKAIVREDTSRLISIMKDSYKVVPNKDVIMPLLEQLDKMDTKYIFDETHSFVEDAKMRLQIIFPALNFSDGKSEIALSISLHNSFDSTESIKIFHFCLRKICSNGMMINELVKEYQRKHTNGLELSDLKARLDTMYASIPLISHRIDLLKDSPVTKKARTEVENRLGKHVLKFIADREKQTGKIRDMYSLYNAVTYYVSHIILPRLRTPYQLETSRLFKL